MGSRYLTDLADVARTAGLTVQEEPGWQTRSRSSGGYESGRPVSVIVHHTASNPSSDGQADVNYCCYGSENRPIANLYLARSGKVWIMAAGATNCNGTGGPLGPIPVDQANTHVVAIEAANTGTGEVWPDAQQLAAYTTLVRALCDRYNIAPNSTFSHAEYAVGRKIDPAGPSRWAAAGTWPMDGFRDDVATGWPGTHPPPSGGGLISEREASVIYFISPNNETNPSLWASNVATKWLIEGTTMRNSLMEVQEIRLIACGMDPGTAHGFSKTFLVDQGNFRAYGLAVGPANHLAGRDEYGWLL